MFEENSFTLTGAMRTNMVILEYFKTSMSAISGFTAGVIGLYGLYGFIFYFLCAFLLWALILLRIGPDYKRYFHKRTIIFTNGLGSGLFTYVLFWTFLYGMVHVY
ncbi:ER membrane protein complex subunit 6-like [Panonychus citri]|uniref:ER membrane protein complex subunit 6-like n=1 Tax=Panonychus citri TaxID=50023 RepID=UPI00230827DA|nr:ER membrane protein complex subunit 6-like [Panonychus citri]